MEHNTQFLESEPAGRLMHRYPLRHLPAGGGALQHRGSIFIANASYLGSYGNAANTVVFPLTVVALAIAVMIGKAILLQWNKRRWYRYQKDFASVTWRTIDRWEQGSVQIFKSTRERYFKQGLERQKLFR